MGGAFQSASNMVYRATDAPDLSDVNYMGYMFFDASSFNANLSSWNVSNVTYMEYMFADASSFNGNLSSWDVSSVINMNNMFSDASSFNANLSSWNVSRVTDMYNMFSDASSFKGNLSSWNVSSVTTMYNMFSDASSFNANLSSWNVSSVTTMSNMFDGASSFNANLSSWDVSSVIYMDNMFDGADSFDQNLGTWYIVPAVTNFDAGDASLDITTISTQNQHLRDQTPAYGIGSGDHSDLFEMRGSTLAFKATPVKGSYQANVTASGNDVFENGNNWRVLDITVPDSPPTVQAGGDQTVGEGDTVTLSGSAMDPDGDPITYTWLQTGPAAPRITFANASAPFTTFTAPAVTGDTTFTITLTADGGGQSVEDTLKITVKETSTAFITTWTATDSDKSITLPMKGMYSILWGDGSNSTNVSDSQSHVYSTAGNYTVTVLGGGLLSINLSDDTANAHQLESIEQWGSTEWTSMDAAFSRAKNMAYNATDSPDLSGVTDMSRMFNGAHAFNGDISSWDVSSVTDMNSMFASAEAFNQPLNTWDVSSVTTMNSMFFGASSFDGDISGWDVSSVTNMNSMFFKASFFDQPLNTWDVSSVTNMGGMFSRATAFDQDLANWYVVQDLPPVLTANATLSIRAQNSYLDGLVSTYSINDTRFVMDGKTLSLNSTNLPLAGMYPLDITAPAVLGEPNASTHTRTVTITVSDPPAMPFITTWRTDSANQTITIPVGGSTARYSIDWGDNSPAGTDITGDSTHTYREADSYTVSISGGLERFHLDGLQPNAGRLISIDQWGDTRWTTMDAAFDGATNMVYRATDTPDLGLVSDMSRMFAGAAAFDGDLSSWDVSKVTNMESMFRGASSFNQPLNNWNVSSVTDMTGMFYYASSFNQPLNSWDVSSVSDMGSMFYEVTDFNQPLNTWDVSAVRDMTGMFSGASSFNQPLNSWDVSKVTNMVSMFRSASSFNQPLNSWNVSSVRDMVSMFFGATSFDGTLSDWNVSSVSDMGSMFSGASSFNQPLNNWNGSSVTDMTGMFSGASSFNQTLNAWDVSKVTDMRDMFYQATDFNQPLNAWDVSSVTYMIDMFDFATAFSQNLGNWYVTLDPDTIAGTGIPGVVGTISAQNQPLKNHSPTYVIVDGLDKNHFEIVPGNQLNMISGVSGKAEYSVNVTASGSNVFEDGNNWRLLEITVRGSTNTDSAPPAFVSSMLDMATGSLTITFSEEIDAANIVPAKIHIRESGNYTGGVTLTAGELGTAADASTISFTLTRQHQLAVAGLAAPELTIEPGAVQDTSGNRIVGSFDVSTAAFVAPPFSISSQEDSPTGMAFSNDGTKMFVLGFAGEDINEYTLSTAFDVSTATFVSPPFSISLQDTNPQGMAFSNDGAKMFVVGYIGEDINEYTLSTAFDVSTAAFVAPPFSISSQDTFPTGMAFSNDGAKMFVVGYIGEDINEYTLSTAFDVSTATFVSPPFSISSQDTNPQGMAFSNDGAKMFVVGSAGNDIGEYTLSTAFDVSTASFVDAFDVSLQETFPTGMAFSNDGAKMFVLGFSGGDINEYTLSSVYPITVTGPPAGAFITTWKTTSADESITLPLVGTDITINWGDGSTTAGVSTPVDHTYNTAGNYTVQITGGLTWFHLNNAADASKLVSLDQWGTASWASMENAFSGASNMVYNAGDAPDLSGVTDMSNMFASAAAFDGDLSSWDVSSVTDMNSMFSGASVFNQPLNDWNVSSVTDMSGMFYVARSFNQPLNDWNVSSVTDMSGMFYIARSFNQLLNDWNVSSVTDMNNMFAVARSFNQPLNDWNVSSVTDMNNMFAVARSFNQPLNDWNVSSVTDMHNMFHNADDFNQPLNSWNVSRVTNMDDMFNFATAFSQNLGNWYVVANATSIARADVPGVVAEISAQNDHLNGHNPTYGIGMDSDYAFFEIVNGNKINMTSVGTKSSYMVNVTASGSNVFESGNNWRLLEIKVTGQTTDTTSPVIKLEGSSLVTITVDETYTEQGAVCDDDVDADKPATVGGDTVDTSTVGQYTVTYDCTDTAGNVATQVLRTVNVQSAPDTDAPVIIITGSANIQLTVDETYTEQGATCEDNVDADKPATVGGDTVDTSTAGQYTVTYDCTDSSNNEATQVSRTVNVQSAPDTDAPVIIITGSANIQLTVDDTYTEQGATCEDNVDADKPATVGGDTVDTSTAGQYTVTYDCTDSSNNEATQVSRTVNVQSAPDTDAPVIIITGSANIQLTVDETYTEEGATCEDNVDADKPATVGGDTVDTSTVGQYTVTYDCTDSSNNEATQVSRTVNVQSAPDTDAPVIIITGLTNIQLTVDETYTEQGAVCEDNVDADKPATVGGDTVDTSTVGQYTVTYDCTDSSNNEATQVSRTVNVQSAPDTDAPVIIITGSANIQLTVDETYTEQGATCEDNVDADKPATVGGDTVDTSTVGQYTVTYDCTDSSNNEATQVSRTVNVQSAPDTDAPVIIITGLTNIQLTVDETYTEQGATCEDNVDADKPATVGGDTVDTSTVGQYTVTYDCTDSSNNEATQVSRTVNVQSAPDTDAPVIIITGLTNIQLTVDETYTEQGAVCEDNVDADKPATVGGDTVDTSTVGQYTVTYDCTDSSNNEATQVSRTVNVQSAPDTDAPVIIITGLTNIQLTVDETYTEQGAVCDDDVDADKAATVGGDTVDTSTVGQYTVTYDCTDSSNNEATQVSRTVNVQSAPDTDAPVIIITGLTNIQLTVDETYTEQGAVCDDNVDADKPATVGGDTVDTSTVGQYTVTYDCTDSSNNEATQVSRTVNVQSAPDTDAPVIIITGLTNIQLTVDETYTEQGAVCEDNVDADKAATVGGDTVDTSTVGQYTVTYDCTDSSNNEATQVSRTVNVQSAPDTDAPVIIITGLTNIQLTVDETYTEQGAVCEDNVDADKAATVGGDTVDTSTVGQYTVTYDCTDSSNNEATQVSRTVNVQSAPDTDAPVIIITGLTNIQLTVDETYTEQGAVCEDNVDADKPATVGGDTVDTSTVGQYTVTYDCTDSSNNEATQVSRTVNVQSAPDTDAPVIIITGLTNIQLTVDETYTEQGAVCEDNVDADKAATVGGDTVDTSTVGQYTVTYDCTDSSNNEATQVSRTVNVQSAPDTDAPVIIITGLTNIQLTVDETYTEQGAVCDDDVDADKAATVGGDTVDTSTVGQYTVTYDCTDSSNNEATQVSRTVNVQSAPDTDAPVIIITGLTNIQLTVDETYTEQGAVCDDDVDADKPATVGGDTVDTSTVGQYTVTYDCTDSSNNEATQVSRTVNVQSAPDTDAPVIIITGLTNIQLTVDETYTEQGAVCEDNVDADKPATVGGDTVDTSTVGQYTVTYDCTDSSNNEATQVSRTVNVQSAPDTDAPVIIITGSANIQLTVDETYTEQGAVCEDNVDADKPATVGGDTVDTSTVGQYTVTYDCTDSSNNEATQVSRTVIVQTAVTPRITLSADAFITTWRTDSANQTITIPVGGSTARYSIDWGDNSPAETDITGDSTHTYREADSYTVSISGGLERFHLDGQQPNAGMLASIEQWGDTRWTTMDAAFDGATNMVYRATDTPDLSGVTDMHRMFGDASFFNGDLSSWDVSKVTDMSDMFIFAYDFNGDLSSWDVSSVTNMNEMFAVATSFNQPLNDWDVSSVTYMSGMFYYAYDFNQPLNSWDVSSVTNMNDMFAVATSFNQPLNDWDVSSVTYMSGMFEDATDFNQPLNSWNVSRVTNMDDMFNFATAFSQNLGEWYVVQDPPVLTANAMFPIRAQNSYLDGLVSTYSIDDTRFVMDGKTLSLNSTNLPPVGMYPLDITAPAVLGEPNAEEEGHTRTLIVTVKGEHRPFITTWTATDSDKSITLPMKGMYSILWGDGSNSTNVSDFQSHTYSTAGNYTVTVLGDGLKSISLYDPNDIPNALQLKSIDQWGDTRWTTMNRAFDGATNMVYRATDAPDLSDVDYTGYMFYGTSSFNGNLSSWDVSSVTHMEYMFASTSSFNGDLSSWDVSSVTDMSGMFFFASVFNHPLNDWDVSSVTEMDDMFYQATDFNQPLNDWDVSSVTDIGGMFSRATNFNQPLNDWNVSSVTDMNDMFAGATSFNQPLNSWNVSKVSRMVEMFANTPSFQQNLGNWYVVANATSIARADVPGVVAEISAQNDYLNDHNPTYGISRDNDYAFFEIVNGNKINMTSVGTKSSYMVNVTASGSNVFEDGNNWRVLAVSVSAALSDNADLGGLTISSGTLSPQFSSSDITYTASVDNSVTQVTVTPTASDSLATITVNDNTVTSGNGYIVIGLIAGESNTVTVIVTAQDSTTKTYIITLTRAASLSGNADLGGLTISSGTLSPQFSSSDITYTASVDNSVTQVTVTPTVSDSSATITVNDNTVTSGTGHIVIGLIAGEPNTVTVIVTAQDSTTKTYIITLTRAASLSGNADLGGLTISSGTLSPQFSSSDITYTASVDNSVTQVTVTPTVSDSSATITVNDNTVTSGNGYIVIGLIAGEPNTVTVIVTAQDSTTKTYIITLTRAASLSGNADLGGLTISSGTLSPQFSSSDITYTASVDNSVTQVTVTPTVSDSLATITVNDNTVTSGNGYIVIGLIAGEPNTVTVIVTAQDSTTKTYIITLTRAALSDNADLGGLTISSGTLSPQFSSSDITYTASVDNSVTQVTVTPTVSDSLATITVNGNTVISGIGYIVTGLTVGEPNTVTVIVTAQDSTTKTYIITLTRAASLSGNADLGGLTISSGTLSPQFSSSDITYTASVDNSVTQVTVTPTVSDSLATITVNDNTVTSGNGYIVIGLIAGESNTVTVIVTAQDSTTKTYIITLTRAASLSGNADLGGLTISSGTLSPQFSSSDITYTASVDNSVTQVTVTPTVSDSSATITVNDNTVTSGNGYIVIGLIAGEPNTVTVIVTAQDSTTKTYIITLTRAALSDNADLGGLTISSGTLSPQFSSSDITYTASVDNSVTQVTVTPTVSDNADLGGLTISDSSATITVNGNTVISGIGYIVTGLTVGEPNTVTVIVTAQDSTTKTYIITVTVRDVPITVSSAAYNPGNGQLTITFNQDIATVDYSRLHVRSSANPDTGGITLSSVTGADYSGRTITATLDSEQQDQYDALQSPHLVVEDGAVTDTDGDRTTDVPPQPIRDASQKGSSSSHHPRHQ